MKRNVHRAALAAAGFAPGRCQLGGARARKLFRRGPVTLIVPGSAGGSTDVGMRALAGAAEKHLGQSIVVENRPGGSGALRPGPDGRDGKARTATRSRRFRSQCSAFPS